MELTKTTRMQGLPTVEPVRSIVFCDLDGTYLDHHPGVEERKDLRTLEDYLRKNCSRYGMIFGWVTGCVWQEVVRKFRNYDLTTWPHFIAAGLGTELYHVAENGTPVRDEQWSSILINTGFNRSKAENAVVELKRHDVSLTLQNEIHQNELKFACYYASKNDEADNRKLAAIRETARKYGLSVKITRCGQGVGDPEGSFDVDFIPKGAGKVEIVQYLLEKYGLTSRHALAFGDSSNDLEVLHEVGHGYLVANADPVAKQAFGSQTPAPHAAGVLWGLRKHISN